MNVIAPESVLSPPAIEGEHDQGARLRPSVGLAIGGSLLAFLVIGSIVVPLVSSYSPDAFVGVPLQSPSWSHLLGTDDFGRDVLVRVAIASRLDMLVALVGVSVPLVLGTLVGMMAGMARSTAVRVLVRAFVDAVVAFPFMVLVLALVILFGADRSLWFLPPGLPAFLAAVFVVNWTLYARLAYAATLGVAQHEFVEAARLLGYSPWRLGTRHILPSVARQTLAYAASDAVLIIIVLASLPFLGAGVQPPTAEWGAIMYEGRTVLQQAWWISVFPGVAMAIFGVAISLVADAALAKWEP